MINTSHIVVQRLELKYIIHILTLTDDTTLTCHMIEYSSIISFSSEVGLSKRKRNSILYVFTSVLTPFYKYYGF